MARKHHTADEIIAKLRLLELLQPQGRLTAPSMPCVDIG